MQEPLTRTPAAYHLPIGAHGVGSANGTGNFLAPSGFTEAPPVSTPTNGISPSELGATPASGLAGVNALKIRTTALAMRTTGAAVAQTYPMSRRMTSFTLSANDNIALIAATLDSSTVNPTADCAIVALVLDGTSELLNLEQTAGIIVIHMTEFTDTLAMSRSTTAPFSEGAALRVESGRTFGLYVCAPVGVTRVTANARLLYVSDINPY